MGHIVLLGDSIFDNASYTRGEPDVVTHLQRMLPPGWDATLLAVDGASTRSMAPQVSRVPRSASHLAVSVGGNDALGNVDLLASPARSTTDALRLFRTRVEAFEQRYRAALDPAFALGLPVTLCTIYNGRLEDPAQAALARIALMLFNDAILRVAFERGAPAVDLRLVCCEPADYANPIEPSGRGGQKIARAVARAAGALEREGDVTLVFRA